MFSGKPAAQAVLFAAVFALTACLAARVEDQLAAPAPGGMALYGQASGGRSGAGRTYQRIQKGASGFKIEYGFLNFNKDPLYVNLQMLPQILSATDQAYGYTQKDLDALKAWQEKARNEAFQKVVASRGAQAQADAAVAAVDEEYRRRRKKYLADKGFKFLPGNLVAVDMPLLVRRNRDLLNPVARIFSGIAEERGYDSDLIVGAATSMAQTAIEYRIPPPVEGDRHIGGVLHPLKALTLGWGDCDTKTGLLSAILANWDDIKMVGVALPGHYLMGFYRSPMKGDVYVERDGLTFVLIEPAGPAWLQPGTVGRETLALLEGSGDIEIEKFN